MTRIGIPDSHEGERTDASRASEARGPIPGEPAAPSAPNSAWDSARPTRLRSDRSLAGKSRRRFAYLSGWRGGSLSLPLCEFRDARMNFARGIEHRRIAMKIEVWFPGRAGGASSTVEERQTARAAVRAYVAAQRAAANNCPRRASPT